MTLRQMIVLAGFTLASSVSHAAVNLINTESTVGGNQVNRDSSQSTFAPSGSYAQGGTTSPSVTQKRAPLPGIAKQGSAKTTAYLPPAGNSVDTGNKNSTVRSNSLSHSKAAQQGAQNEEASKELKQVWTAHQGETLRQSLGRWSQEAGFRLVWDTRINYSMVANVSFEGSYITSASKLIEAYEESSSPLTVDFYPTQSLTLVKERTAE